MPSKRRACNEGGVACGASVGVVDGVWGNVGIGEFPEGPAGGICGVVVGVVGAAGGVVTGGFATVVEGVVGCIKSVIVSLTNYVIT